MQVHYFCTADFGSWTSLTELNLGSNQLTALPEDIQELTRLETLVLSNNMIRVRENISQCCFVLSIVTQTLPKGVSALRNLRELDLEGNRLEYLATEISEY